VILLGLESGGLENPHLISAPLQTNTLAYLLDLHQNVAIGLIGEPVPSGIASGAAVRRNSQR
jgi:hypothetical protein